MNPETLEAELLRLPPLELARLVRVAMVRLEDAKAINLLFSSPDEEEIERFWLEEAARRAKAIDEGKMELIPGDVVRTQVRASLERMRRE